MVSILGLQGDACLRASPASGHTVAPASVTFRKVAPTNYVRGGRAEVVTHQKYLFQSYHITFIINST